MADVKLRVPSDTAVRLIAQRRDFVLSLPIHEALSHKPLRVALSGISFDRLTRPSKSDVDHQLKDAIIERDAAMARYDAIKAAKYDVDRQLEDTASSLKDAQADLKRVEARLGHAEMMISQANQPNLELLLKRLNDIEYRTEKSEKDAKTMARI